MAQINHTEYPKQIRHKTMAALMFIIKDCQEAIAANPENPKCGYYADEINYAGMEIVRRQK